MLTSASDSTYKSHISPLSQSCAVKWHSLLTPSFRLWIRVSEPRLVDVDDLTTFEHNRDQTFRKDIATPYISGCVDIGLMELRRLVGVAHILL